MTTLDVPAISAEIINPLYDNNFKYVLYYENVLKGQKVVKEISIMRNIPIKYVCCLEGLVDKLPKDLEGGYIIYKTLSKRKMGVILLSI